MGKVMINELGIEKKVEEGFSWPILFFGPIVPLIKGDFKHFFIILTSSVFSIILNYFPFLFIISKSIELIEMAFSNYIYELDYFYYNYSDYLIIFACLIIINLVFSFVYNNFYINQLLKKGYTFKEENL